MDVAELSSRPGALIAGTWAAMHYMGEKYVMLGYLTDLVTNFSWSLG